MGLVPVLAGMLSDELVLCKDVELESSVRK